jgi:hypothetical protein
MNANSSFGITPQKPSAPLAPKNCFSIAARRKASIHSKRSKADLYVSKSNSMPLYHEIRNGNDLTNPGEHYMRTGDAKLPDGA